MGFKIELIAVRIIEVMFFTGISGCIVVVILSWISVGKDSFSRK